MKNLVARMDSVNKVMIPITQARDMSLQANLDQYNFKCEMWDGGSIDKGWNKNALEEKRKADLDAYKTYQKNLIKICEASGVDNYILGSVAVYFDKLTSPVQIWWRDHVKRIRGW